MHKGQQQQQRDTRCLSHAQMPAAHIVQSVAMLLGGFCASLIAAAAAASPQPHPALPHTPPPHPLIPSCTQVAYLQQDCDAALVKIRVALCPADTCNLPPGSQVAPVEAITLLADSAAAAASRKACAAASSKAAADGRNNAAAAAAVVNGWLGPVDEDGLMLGLDDLAWDEEVLLGEGPRAGFGLGGLRFEPNTRLSFGMTPSKSGLGSQVSEKQPCCLGQRACT